ncbi:peptidase S41 [Porphyromonadaceae bacterium COT-184 OH4590]|nr:peptidase S41 [Porphyromonadaceae bacterium COT-184 OH4590]
MKKAFIPLIATIGIALGVIIGNFYAKRDVQEQLVSTFSDIIKSNDKLTDVVNIIEKFYVDTVVADSLVEQVIPEIIAQLDPHSAYIPAKDLQMVNEELSGSFFGIGVQFNLQNDTVYIINVIPGGPSEKVGLLAGDRIVTVNDSLFVGKKITNEKVISTLRGDNNTKIKLGIVRRGSEDITQYTVTRGEVPINSIDISYMITTNVGYVSVNKFGETTYKEFLNALTSLRRQGANSLIIDLRGNVGGYLGAAVDMLNEFLAKGDLIVYIQGAHQKRVDSYADGTGSFQNMKLAVLIDEFSGSASEIFAGAIQDNDRGVIVGRRSFGKGLVQKPIRLKDKSEIRLTVAKYYTPSGRSIQKPYSKGNIADYEMDLINRFNHGEFYSRDSIKENTSEVYHTKGGRIVYGGGGIMPDFFVPSDTVGATKYFTSIANKGITYRFALNYTDRNRAELKHYKTLNELQSYLERQNLYPQIVKFAEQNGIIGKEVERAKSKKHIERQTIAYIIRNILDEKGFYPYINQTDMAVKKALSEL